MKTEKFMFKCDVCGNMYQHGPYRYEGHRLERYGNIFCCDTCWTVNWDGWAPHHEKILLAHLEKNSLPVPKRNKKGLLPRD